MNTELLKKACDLYGQRKTGEMIGKSATTVNLLLKDKYPNPDKHLQRVNEVFAYLKEDKCKCPILGEISIETCKKYKDFSKQGKIYKNRLYMQVKDHCMDCKRNKNG